MRYERKYRIEEYDFPTVLDIVRGHPASFRKLYPDRQINNIYLDTPDLTFFHENLVGASDRTKFRVRWYGENPYKMTSPTLEAKIKQGELGKKAYAAFPDFEMMPFRELEAFFQREINSKLTCKPENEPAKELANGHIQQDFVFPDKPLKPVLVNTYLRTYLISYDGKFRLTIDRKMNFANPETGLPKLHQFEYDDAVVVEIKYEMEDFTKWDFIGQNLPFRLSKNSKYVNGLLLTGNV